MPCSLFHPSQSCHVYNCSGICAETGPSLLTADCLLLGNVSTSVPTSAKAGLPPLEPCTSTAAGVQAALHDLRPRSLGQILLFHFLPIAQPTCSSENQALLRVCRLCWSRRGVTSLWQQQHSIRLCQSLTNTNMGTHAYKASIQGCKLSPVFCLRRPAAAP